jgi:colanic acid/amylovoran biosynthesis glycosyltransferase
MKIAFVVNQFPCLSETFVLRQITGLFDRGHEVDVFAYGAGQDPVRHGAVEKYGLLSRTSYLNHCACSHSAAIRVVKRFGLFVTHFHKDPWAVLKALNVRRFGKGALLLQLFCQIAPFLTKGPYDVIHCQFGNLGQLGLLLKDTGVFAGKLVTSFRGYDASSYVKAHGNHVYDDLFKRCDLFLCVSSHIRDRLIRLGCDEQKIIVHRSGVTTKKSFFPPRSVDSGGKLKILTVARLEEKKGVEYGIRAVAHVLNKNPRIEYKIAGDGPMREQLRCLIDELNVGDHVALVGWRSEAEIVKLFQTSDILLAPSITATSQDQEGIPGAIIEACAHGLPVIATAHAGIPEVIEDGRSGFLVPERDAEALAERLDLLTNRPELRLSMGRIGRQFVEANYDIEKLNDRLVEIYESVPDGERAAQSRTSPYGCARSQQAQAHL